MKKPPVFLYFLLVILVVYILGAATAAWIHVGWQGSGGWVDETFLRKGPHRLMTRMSMIWFVLLLPIILKGLQWRGRSDTGWIIEGQGFDRVHVLADIRRGCLLATITILPALIIMALAGGRIWDVEATLGGCIGIAFSAAISAIFIGLIEETLARGIVFRSLSRCWKPWPAALALSLTFALAHFIRPTESSFDQPSLFAATLAALESMPQVLADTSHVLIRTLNLTLMSLTLCAMVMKRHTIWMAVGAHATWVALKKIYGYLTDSVRDPQGLGHMLGQKTDSTDSFIATILLSGLLIWIICYENGSSQATTPANKH